MKLVWTASAKADLGDIITYIWLDDPSAAKLVRMRIEKTTLQLASQPYMGTAGVIEGTREALPHSSYEIVYQLGDDTVSILRIIHTSRQWPPADEDDG